MLQPKIMNSTNGPTAPFSDCKELDPQRAELASGGGPDVVHPGSTRLSSPQSGFAEQPISAVNPDDQPHMMGWQKKRLSDIARALKSGELVAAVTAREFLSWFWKSQRRGRWITSYIRDQLEAVGLITVPDFESTYLDAEIQFQLAIAGTRSTNDAAVDGAQVIKVVDHSEVKVSPPAFADPTYRISKLAAANRFPVSVKPDASLTEAVTLMMTHDFSQLPVMVNEREVKGMVSWNSIGTRLALRQGPEWVREAMDPHAEVSSEASLFTAIPVIVEHGYALVRSSVDKRIVGIITTSDLSLQFQQLSEPFLLLGEIENHIRRIINARFRKHELMAVKDETDTARSVESVADLTFGEYQRLLEDPKRWAALRLDLDRGVFIQRLERVRVIRNEVMHFDPDGIEVESLLHLRDFVKFLRMLQTIGAT
jgi:CBS domain-containing protein